jgi:hypothetical protein
VLLDTPFVISRELILISGLSECLLEVGATRHEV